MDQLGQWCKKMPGNIRLWGTSGYVELAAPSTAANQVLTLPTDTVQPGMVLISSQTVSSASSISLNNCFSSTYLNYKFIWDGSVSSSSGVYFRLRSSGTDLSSSVYYAHQMYQTDAAGPSRWYGPASSGIIFDTGDSKTCISGDIFSPFANTPTIITSSLFTLRSALTNVIGTYSGAINNSISYDGMSLVGISNTLTGSLRIYGYRNS